MADIPYTHSFSGCRTTWHQLSILEQELLLQLSSKIWNGSEDIVDEAVPNSLLQGLEQKEILIQEKGKWQFNSPAMLFFTQSLNLINELSLDTQSASKLFQYLLQLPRERKNSRSFEEHQELGTFIFAQLINQFNRVDLLELIISDDTTDRQFWDFYDYVRRALSILELSVDHFVSLLKGLAKRTQNDMAGAWVFSSTRQLGSSRPKLSLEIIDQLISDSDWESATYLVSLMIGISENSIQHTNIIIERCETWIGSQEGDLCQAGLNCLQHLTLVGKYTPSRFLEHAKALISSPLEGVPYALSLTITEIGMNFAKYVDTCFGMLTQLKTRGPDDQIYRGIAIALQRTKTMSNFKIDCLSLLTDIPIADKGTIEKVARVLYPIAHSYPGEVWNYLEKWILAHKLTESIIEHNLFLSTIQSAYKNNEELTILVLTRWFASSDQRLVEEARSIIRELKIHSFADEEIKAMPPQKVIYITEKLLIGHLDSIQIVWLCYSILFNTNDFEKLEDYFLRVLRYLAWNYPGGMTEFLDQGISNGGNSEVTKLLQNVRQEIEQHLDQVKGIRGLFSAELAPSQRRIKEYWDFQNKVMQRITEATRDDDRFPLQKLLSRVAVGRGDRSFFMNILHPVSSQRRTFSEPQGFGQFSHSTELPKGEFIDPEGEAWARIQRLNLQPDGIQLRES